jgi:hypothetical protein
VRAAVAHVQAVNDGVAQWSAALDNSPAHATTSSVTSYIADVRSSFDLQITRAPWRSSMCCVGYTNRAFVERGNAEKPTLVSMWWGDVILFWFGGQSLLAPVSGLLVGLTNIIIPTRRITSRLLLRLGPTALVVFSQVFAAMAACVFEINYFHFSFL